MKIRKGFVSNSSSSSFCILGAVITDLIKLEEGGEEYDDFLDRKLKDTGLDYAEGIGDYCGQLIVGVSPDKLDENLTIKKHKKNIHQQIVKVFNVSKEKVDVAFHTDGGYEG